MRKLLIFLLIAAVLVVLGGCGVKSRFAYDAPAEGVLGTDNMDLMLRKFLNISDEHPNGDMGERRPFSESEKAMSEHAEKLMLEIADGDEGFDVDVTPYGVSGYGETRNVIARKRGTGEEPRKLVVIGANYDAFVKPTGGVMSLEDKKTVTESVGAMENGTGCAVVLALMQYVKGRSYEFDIEFVLFGDGSYGNTGATRYVSDMSAVRKENILIMFALRRFGGDNLYMYNEEIKTDYGKYLLDTANENKLGIKALPKQMPVIDASAFPRLPYAHWAMASVHAPFMNEHIPVASVLSGNYETLNLSDAESASSQIVSYSRQDTYTRLKRDFSAYADQMTAAANLIASALGDPFFAETMTAARQSFKNYDAATNKLAVSLAIIGALALLGVAVVIIAKQFEKKYPYVPPRVKIKIAVFGAEYENGDADVLIDVKKPDDPFAGY